MEVQLIKLNKIKVNDKNPRTITEDKLRRLVDSILVFPKMLTIRPIVVDDKGVALGGNMRTRALKEIKKIGRDCIPERLQQIRQYANKTQEEKNELLAFWDAWFKEQTVPVIYAGTLTEEEKREFIIKDNSSFGAWDWDVLANEWDAEQLEDWGVDTWQIDETEDEGNDNEVNEDNFDAGNETITPKVQYGDIWLLGEHRIMCGDSTNADDVAKLMNGEKAELLFTSPPYSDMREYRGGKTLDPNHLAHFVQVYASYARFEAVNLGLQMKNHEIFPYWDAYIDLAHEVNLKILAWNVWDKTTIGSIGAQKQFFPLRHEWIFVFGKEPKKLNKYVEKKTKYDPNKTTRLVRKADGHMSEDPIGDCSNPFKTIESVLAITPEYSSEARHLHPAVFPIALPAEYIKSLTNENDNVIEPFGGSGTTLIACEQLGRKCRLMELDPHYCDVIIARWEMLTGEQAVKIE